MKVHMHVNYGGNCADAFRFYEQHLGGKISLMMTHGDSPQPDKVPAGWEQAILYAHMMFGETELSGNDVPPAQFQPMRSAYVSLSVDSTKEADRIFTLLSDGGQIFMPIAETFFAFRFGMLRDKFGTSWMILHDRPMAPRS
jgi:PhnB protein